MVEEEEGGEEREEEGGEEDCRRGDKSRGERRGEWIREERDAGCGRGEEGGGGSR